MNGSADPQTAAANSPHRRGLLVATALFGALLGLSLMALAFSIGVYLGSTGRSPMAAEAQSPGLVLAVSVATSIVSLIGLLSTNLLAWRREAREARSAEVQLERQQLEIEKLKLELEKQKRGE